MTYETLVLLWQVPPMSYNEIAVKLFRDELGREDAIELALARWREDCLLAEKRWGNQRVYMRDAAQRLLDHAHDIVDQQYYSGCVKAAFFASLWSLEQQCSVTEIEATSEPWDGFDCTLCTRLEDNPTCTRIETAICGDRYDNCMSVHAAQWLRVPDRYVGREYNLLWMEAGAVRNAKGIYELANSELANNPTPYRCSMCLKTMLGQGITDLCNIGQDANGELVMHLSPLASTLSCLVLTNCAKTLHRKDAADEDCAQEDQPGVTTADGAVCGAHRIPAGKRRRRRQRRVPEERWVGKGAQVMARRCPRYEGPATESPDACASRGARAPGEAVVPGGGGSRRGGDGGASLASRGPAASAYWSCWPGWTPRGWSSPSP